MRTEVDSTSDFLSPGQKLPSMTVKYRKMLSAAVSKSNYLTIEHCFREAGAGGSNPLTPTIINRWNPSPSATKANENKCGSGTQRVRRANRKKADQSREKV